MKKRLFYISLLISIALPARAEVAGPSPEIQRLNPAKVMARPAQQPLIEVIDPRAPVQPVPVQDGADILRTLPGFSVIRKGGADGDPVLRGMAGSRLGILLDGELILGGCGNRMDPPTAYVFPSSFDEVRVVRGPQTVRYGAGHSAGVVLFERHRVRMDTDGLRGTGSFTVGSFGRNDQFGELRWGTLDGYLRSSASHSASGNFKDGSGREVHSRYQRWSWQGAAGWTPTEHRLFEVSGIVSDGEAAYADRGMDGTKFARQNVGLRFSDGRDHGLLRGWEGNVYYNYIDHVMDNFSLRTFRPSPMMPGKTASNPDRETFGGKLSATVEPLDHGEWELGLDYQANRHTVRRTSNADLLPVTAIARARDASFRSFGVYAEGDYSLSESHRLVAGVRGDFHEVEDLRQQLSAMGQMLPNPTAGQTRNKTLPSGFGRWEWQADPVATTFLGLGHSQRFPDYWEFFNKEGASSLSALGLDPEKTTQVDAGLIVQDGRLAASVSVFANMVKDFILIDNRFAKGNRLATVARNVDTRAVGGEAAVSYDWSSAWRTDASLSYVYADNRTDGIALAQQPPLEGRFGLSYSQSVWSVGSVVRAVARQDRIAVGQGNIVGQDLAETGGFAVFGLNASWQPHTDFLISAGVDNLFDRNFAEHLSRGGAMVAGFPPPTTRVNEPGRMLWLRVDARF